MLVIVTILQAINNHKHLMTALKRIKYLFSISERHR